MILTCPQCATRYEADATKFPAAGRKVRCAKCARVWHQAPETPPDAEPEFVPVEDAAPPSSPPQHTAFAPPAEAAPALPVTAAPPITKDAPRSAASIGRVVRTGASWAALAAIVFVVGWSAVRFRQDIAVVWPQTASLYKAIGKPVNATGFTVKDLGYRNETSNGQQVLAVTGRVVNLTMHELALPRIHVTLTDSEKRVLSDWSFSTSVARLAAGKSVAFVTRLVSPPTSASGLQVRVADNGK